jgi:carbonic anhydrase/acetyltransferase-like protein (isoleucine patch superfamily)
LKQSFMQRKHNPKSAYRVHPNGGGLKHKSSTVNASAWVAPDARIGARARVCGGARIGPKSKIGKRVSIYADVTIGTNVAVGRGTEILCGARIGDGAVVGGKVFAGFNAIIEAGARIPDKAIVAGVPVPVIPDVYRRIWEGTQAGVGLDLYSNSMPNSRDFAQWAVHVAGEAGRKLEENMDENYYLAASLIFRASRPDLPEPSENMSLADALEELKRRAESEPPRGNRGVDGSTATSAENLGG